MLILSSRKVCLMLLGDSINNNTKRKPQYTAKMMLMDALDLIAVHTRLSHYTFISSHTIHPHQSRKIIVDTLLIRNDNLLHTFIFNMIICAVPQQLQILFKKLLQTLVVLIQLDVD